jgi:glycosyltransferase involved in cell wall biosynthesis
VRFHGRLPRPLVHARLKAARVLVLPSAREGYGMVVAEAQACGSVPVVARGPMSAAGALVRDGVDGLLCEPSAAGISAAVTELLLDPARRRAMAAAGRRASGGRSWESAAAAIEEVYRSALRRPALAAVTA